MPVIDPETRRETPREAGLRFTTDARPGITRRRAGQGWSYRRDDGTLVRDRATLARIRSLVVPPAWTDVWICPDPSGTCRQRAATPWPQAAPLPPRLPLDPRAREVRSAARLRAVAARHPDRIDEDLARPGLPRQKVLAAVVRLLELTLIRVGNDEYARLNRSFGLTTLRDHHAKVTGSRIRFRFRGKSGVMQDVSIRDQRLARVVGSCQELPGQELLQYVDEDGEVHDVRSEDVNAYLREIAGGDVTAKDFRTWAGTVLAYRALMALQPGETERDARRNVVEAIRRTAASLGNTPAVARRSTSTRRCCRPTSTAASATRSSPPRRSRRNRPRERRRTRRRPSSRSFAIASTWTRRAAGAGTHEVARGHRRHERDRGRHRADRSRPPRVARRRPRGPPAARRHDRAWLATAWWAWRDMEARTGDPLLRGVATAGIVLATPALFPLALIVYLVLRPPRPEEPTRALELRLSELAVGSGTDPDRCPGCHARVAQGGSGARHAAACCHGPARRAVSRWGSTGSCAPGAHPSCPGRPGPTMPAPPRPPSRSRSCPAGGRSSRSWLCPTTSNDPGGRPRGPLGLLAGPRRAAATDEPGADPSACQARTQERRTTREGTGPCGASFAIGPSQARPRGLQWVCHHLRAGP